MTLQELEAVCAGPFEGIAAALADPANAEWHDELIEATTKHDEHPEDYHGPCLCKLCMSYADDVGE